MNDPGWRARLRPRARRRVVHATIPVGRCRVTKAARKWAEFFRTAHPAVRELLRLGPNDQHLPRFGGRKTLQNLRHQLAQHSDRIVRRNQHDHSDLECGKVLLISEFLIDGQEYVELLFGDAQQIAIAFTCPAHLRSGSRIVAGQVAFQASRNAFVKQDAQG